MYAVIDRYKLQKYAYILAALMFITYITLAQGMHLAGIRIPNLIYRNFLVEGFAYFLNNTFMFLWIIDRIKEKTENLWNCNDVNTKIPS